MTSTENLTPRRRRVWNLVRFLIPRRMRWFYEGHRQLRGQLWYAERKLLYETVREHRPELCFEIGTWRGGGSTLFISQALHENGGGVLHTVEISKEFYDDAAANYQAHLPQLMPHIAFHLGDYKSIYKEILEQTKRIDFLILDGAEDGQETLDQYDFFLPYMKQGTILVIHDWFTEKTRLVKPILEDANEWKILRMLEPPASVGLVLAVKQA